MKTHRILLTFLALLFTVMFAWQAMATEVTIVGRVFDSQNIITEDGEIYEVAISDLGDELLLEHNDEKVEVTGTVDKDGDIKIITVLSYRLIKE